MNADERVAPVPVEFVTVTLTAPAACAGVTAAMEVAFTLFTFAAVPPKLTVAPDWKPCPVIVTAVPPSVEPETGDTPLIETVVLVLLYATAFDILFKMDALPTAST